MIIPHDNISNNNNNDDDGGDCDNDWPCQRRIGRMLGLRGALGKSRVATTVVIIRILNVVSQARNVNEWIVAVIA